MGRRSNNKNQYTGVRAETDSSICIEFIYKGRRCRERIKLKPTPANLKAASRHREAILGSIANGSFDYKITFPESPRARELSQFRGASVSIKEYLLRWLEQQSSQVASSTFRDYRKIVINQIIPAIGHIYLADLKRSDVKNWMSKLTCSNKRLANILSPLRIALNEAMDDELISHNPLLNWTFSRREAPDSKYEVDPFSAEEQRRILEALPSGGREMIQFALWTGLRTSELVALEWGDVDWIRGEVFVRRALTEAAAVPETTKTGAGTRRIKLQPPALQALHAQKAISFLHPSGRIWLNPRTREPWTGDQGIRKNLWTPALKRAGVRYRNPYQTRHTYASMMLSAGEPELWVVSQMGHTTVDMIRRNYGRWIPDLSAEAGRKAVEIYWQDTQKNDTNKK